uniref:KatG n=1 Tax=Mycobacterium tuberculosis (strain ATCC 25618 / H37Rv) TaxID=83332 RepID=A0A0N9DS44_MYCTU|nr:KatG [Mycobacterium tuberculosis H37Rv]
MPEQHPPITETTTGAASNGCPVVGHMKYEIPRRGRRKPGLVAQPAQSEGTAPKPGRR